MRAISLFNLKTRPIIHNRRCDFSFMSHLTSNVDSSLYLLNECLYALEAFLQHLIQRIQSETKPSSRLNAVRQTTVRAGDSFWEKLFAKLRLYSINIC